ncbi:MAG: ribonuclease P protein component [Blastocatellia bacterium]
MLRNSRQFRRVYEQGHKFHTPFFSAFFLRNDAGERRYGITATRKIGGAVVRNHCKRRLREILRKYELCPSYPDGFDLVLNVKPELAKADFKQLQESFARMMSRFCYEVDRNPSAEIL